MDQTSRVKKAPELRARDITLNHKSSCCGKIMLRHNIHNVRCACCHILFVSGMMAMCTTNSVLCEETCADCLHYLLRDNTVSDNTVSSSSSSSTNTGESDHKHAEKSLRSSKFKKKKKPLLENHTSKHVQPNQKIMSTPNLKKRGRPKGPSAKKNTSEKNAKNAKRRWHTTSDEQAQNSSSSSSSSSSADSENTHRNLSTRFARKRKSQQELENEYSSLFEGEDYSPQKRQSINAYAPKITHESFGTKGMGHDAVQNAKGIPASSKKSTQAATSLPAIPMMKLNELVQSLNEASYKWQVSDVRGPARTIYITDLNDPLRKEYPTEVDLSYKIYAPCCQREFDVGRCKGDTQCHHCQCGCGVGLGECDIATPRTFAYSHNVMEAVMKTCTGASSEAVNRVSSLSGAKQSDPENISNIREKFLFPILTDLAIVSIECAVLEAKIKYKQLYPLWNGVDPIPIAFAADGRWPKP